MKDRKYNKTSAVITLPYAAIKELKNIPYPFKVGERLVYEPKDGEKIDVCLWVVYPSYDFIFGIPAKDNPYKKEEAGFFQARDRDNKKVIKGFYLSEEELKEIIQGFKKIFIFHRKGKNGKSNKGNNKMDRG